MTKHYTSLTLEFDDRLHAIAHYAMYPEMMVAIGQSYPTAPVRILVLGESHYLDQVEVSNHPDLWYESRNLALTTSTKNIHTRSIFDNAINNRERRKSKAIFHSLASALNACDITAAGARSSLQSIAYMNYFQRPAEVSGKSIRAHSRDISEAARVVSEVVDVLQPQLVVFASRLSWRFAKAELADRLKLAGIQILDVPHPATSWWNRPSRPMNGRTGRQQLVDTVLTRLRTELPDRFTTEQLG